jgi:hypothetical protein
MIDSDTTGTLGKTDGICALEAHLPRGALKQWSVISVSDQLSASRPGHREIS